MLSSGLEEIFIKNANDVGKELFDYFSPSLFKEVTLEKFDFSKEDFNHFTDNNIFFNFEEKCKSTILEKYSNPVEISNSFLKPFIIYYFVILFDKTKYDFVNNSRFFNDCCNSFFKSLIQNFTDNTLNFYDFDYCNSILRKTTDSFFNYISYSFSHKTNMLFSCIEELSILTYEKNNNNGFLLFYPSNLIEKISFQFRFLDKRRFTSDNVRLVRKLLEMSDRNEKIGIISDAEFIYGIAKENKEIEHYSVSFFANNSWKLEKSGDAVVYYKNNRISSLNSDNSFLVIDEFEKKFKTVFSSKQPLENISQCIKTLINENKGTILVISNKAKQLVDDYKDLCIQIAPQILSSENIRKLSSIDGAIIIDEKGMCYGFGVILDGLDTKKGNPARGSRYNSSQRFFYYQHRESDNNPIKLLVFVLSDDGNYNIFPE